MTKLQEHLITWVLEALEAENMTQGELAVAIGISDKHMSQMLTGKVAGTLGLWDAMLRRLGIELQDG